MENSKMIVLSLDEAEKFFTAVVERAIDKKLPEAFRRAQVPEYLLPAQVEREFNISRRSLQYMRDTKKVRYRKIGKRIFFHRDDILEYIRNQTVNER